MEMDDTVLDGLDESIAMQSFRKILQRAHASDAEIWCLSLRFSASLSRSEA